MGVSFNLHGGKREQERRERRERQVVLCVDLCVSVRLVIAGEEDKHHSWMFIRDAWLSRAESRLKPPPPPTHTHAQECHSHSVSYTYASIFEQVQCQYYKAWNLCKECFTIQRSNILHLRYFRAAANEYFHYQVSVNCLVHKMSENNEKRASQLLKILLCPINSPKLRDILINMSENSTIFPLEKLKPVKFGHFCLKKIVASSPSID